MGLMRLFAFVPGPRRWVNLPYAFALLCLVLLSHGDAGAVQMRFTAVLILLFVLQSVWPTRAGWIATSIGWGLYFVGGIGWLCILEKTVGPCVWGLLLYGIIPLAVLVYFRPKAVASPFEMAGKDTPGPQG